MRPFLSGGRDNLPPLRCNAAFCAPPLETHTHTPHSFVTGNFPMEVMSVAGSWSADDFGASTTQTAFSVEDRLNRLRRLARIARLMDTAIGIPGTRLRLGADSVLGLMPVIGDGAGALVGLYIVNEARRLGVPKEKLSKMVGNIAMDACVGSVPLLGDIFDLYFKSHRRNVHLILEHFGMKPEDLK